MKMLELKPKELVYVASILGAKEFFGLKDPFYGMSRNEISAEISAMQMELNANGIIEMDFTGAIHINDSVKSIVSDCAYCDAYVLGEYQKSIGTEQFTLYFKGEHTVLLCSSGEKVILKVSDIVDVLDLVSELIEYCVVGKETSVSKEKCIFSYEIVNEARHLALHESREAARERMLSSGLNHGISEVFLNSFTDNSRRSAFVATNFVTNSVDSILCITDSSHMVCIEKEQEQNWIAFETTATEYLNELDKLLKKVRCSLC